MFSAISQLWWWGVFFCCFFLNHWNSNRKHTQVGKGRKIIWRSKTAKSWFASSVLIICMYKWEFANAFYSQCFMEQHCSILSKHFSHISIILHIKLSWDFSIIFQKKTDRSRKPANHLQHGHLPAWRLHFNDDAPQTDRRMWKTRINVPKS